MAPTLSTLCSYPRSGQEHKLVYSSSENLVHMRRSFDRCIDEAFDNVRPRLVMRDFKSFKKVQRHSCNSSCVVIIKVVLRRLIRYELLVKPTFFHDFFIGPFHISRIRNLGFFLVVPFSSHERVRFFEALSR